MACEMSDIAGVSRWFTWCIGHNMTVTSPADLPRSHGPERTRLVWEVAIVLSLTLGRSAIYSVLSLVRALLSPTPVGEQTAQLNPNRDAEIVWNLVYSLLDIVFDLALVALVIYLLWSPAERVLRRIGLDFTRFGSDVLRALAVGACIGVPGLGLYLAGRAFGLTVALEASSTAPALYMVPILIFSAVRAGLLEEVIMLSYLGDRLRRIGWSTWGIVLSAAALRGLYHAYQGAPSIFGNFVMGIVFGWAYQRWGRVMPLVIAHAAIDIVAFVGYPFAAAWWPGLFTA